MQPLDERRRCLRVYRAVKKWQPEEVVRLVREHPEFHDFMGAAECLVDLVDRELPDLLEPLFQAGLSPDADGGAPRPVYMVFCSASPEQPGLYTAYSWCTLPM